MSNTFQKMLYRQMIDSLCKEPESSADGIGQAVLNGALLSEHMVKETLRSKNPLAPYDLAVLNSNHAALKKLLEVPPENVPEARHGDIGILLKRAEALELLSKEQIELITKIKNVRNGVIHNPRYELDDLRNQLDLIDVFSDHGDPYKVALGLEPSAGDLKRFAELKPKIQELIDDRLENRISEARAAWRALPKAAKDTRAKSQVEGSDEFVIVGPMVCPACGNKTFYYMGFVDFDWNPDGVMTVGSAWLTCKLCEVKIDEDDLAELIEHPQKYAQLDEPDPTWQEFFDYRDMEENAYDYM